MDFLHEWANWKCNRPPFLLKSDQSVFDLELPEGASVTHDSWLDAYAADDFWSPTDTRLHVGLIPQPFIGNVRCASIYIALRATEH